MKRLKLIGSWKRLGVQAGLLTGLGLAFVGGSQQPAMALDPADCPSEGGCTFLKPNLLIVLDYSSSMNEKFGMNNQSRWVAAQDAIVNLLNTDNEYFDKNVNFALIRFGHDPSANPGSTIACDISTPKITDGQAVDHWWYDEMGMDKSFHPCDGDDLEAAVAAIPAPCGGQVTGIGTWTKGALDLARTKIMQSKADHPEDMNKRWYGVMVMSDGKWTSPNGTQTLTPASEDPAITSIDKLNHTGTHPAATDLAVLDAIHQLREIGLGKKQERLRWLQRYWTARVRGLPRVQVLTPSDPQRTCAIATVAIDGMAPKDVAAALLAKHRIHTVAIDRPEAGVRGVRVTPHLYTTTDELDALVTAIGELAKA